MSYPQQYGGYQQGPPQHFHGRPPLHHNQGPPFGPPRQAFLARSGTGGTGPQQFPGQQNYMQNYGQQQQPAFYSNQPPGAQFEGNQSESYSSSSYGIPRAPSQPQTFRAVPPPVGPPTFAKDRRVGAPPYPPPIISAPTKMEYDPESIVTIFIGNIDERVTEVLMKKLIAKCGNVGNWKRVHGANNKLQAFGFCEFLDAESALRAVRLLDQMRLGAKDLQVKIGNKCHPLVVAYKAQMKACLGPKAGEDDVDQVALMRDQSVRDQLGEIIEEHEEELTKPLPDDSIIKTVKRVNKDGGIEEIEMEEDKRQLINREIQNFRDTYKGSDEVLEERIKAAGRSAQNSNQNQSRKQAPDSGERSASVDNDSVADNKSVSSASLKKTRKSRSPSVASSSSSDRMMSMPVKRKDARRLAEQEKLYQEQLEEWIVREKQLAKERARDDEKEKEKRWNEKKTAKRLIRVYEDYDDDRMDDEYYGGTNLSRLLKDRKRELEADMRDREKEQQILEELKQQLIQQGHPAPEAHVRQLELKQNEHMISQTYKDALDSISSAKSALAATVLEEAIIDQEESVRLVIREEITEVRESTTLSFTAPSTKLVKRTGEMFGNSDDEPGDEQNERRKRLFRYDDEVEKKRQAAELKKAQAKKLIERIPTKKEDLFDYPIAWESLDKTLMDVRVKPWISKKIQDYIGEEEPTLVEFITQKVASKATPRSIVSDISMVLDEDAEVFVMKLWRLLVYETEMKKMGLLADN